MALFVLLLRTLQTLVILRVTAFRTTLSWRTFAPFLAYGFLAGPLAVTAAGFFVSPYDRVGPYPDWTGIFVRFVTGICVLFVLLLPVLTLHAAARGRAGLSIADSFLLAWTCGYGLDLQRYLAASAYLSTPLSSFTFVPPGLLEPSAGSAVSVATSCSYLAALPILLYAAGRRFTRSAWISWTLFAAAMLVSALTYGEGMLGTASPLPGKALLQSELPYWICFLGVIALQFLEWHQVKSAQRQLSSAGPQQAAAESGPPLGVMSEWRSAVTALLTGKWTAFRQAEKRFRLALRAEVLGLETARAPKNSQLAEQRDLLQKALSGPSDSSPRAAFPWRLPVFWIQAGLLALLVFLLFFPNTDNWFWNLPLLHFSLADNQPEVTVLNLLLGGFLLWRYVSAAGRPSSSSDADEVVRFAGERALLRTALATVILAFLYGNMDKMYPLNSPIAWLAGASIPAWSAPALTCLALLITAAATGVELPASLRWRQAGLAVRRRAAIERALEAAVLVFGAWVSFPVFRPIQVYLHTHFGPWLFHVFGYNGNSGGATLIALLMIAFTYGVFFLLYRLAAKARRFLCDDAGRVAGATGH